MAATAIPLLEDAGERVSVPPVPSLMVTAVTPEGLAVNLRLSAVRLPSRVVAKVGPVAPEEPKTKVSVATGSAPRSVVPARALAQFVSPALLELQEPPTSPLQ